MGKVGRGLITEVVVRFYPGDKIACRSARTVICNKRRARIVGFDSRSNITALAAVCNFDVLRIVGIARPGRIKDLAVKIYIRLERFCIACNIGPEIAA